MISPTLSHWFENTRKYMIYMLFPISWPAPPKHDRQHFLKKEKFSSSYPGVSNFSTNQNPAFYRCFQIWGWAGAAKRPEKCKQGVLCFFLLLLLCVLRASSACASRITRYCDRYAFMLCFFPLLFVFFASNLLHLINVFPPCYYL